MDRPAIVVIRPLTEIDCRHARAAAHGVTIASTVAPDGRSHVPRAMPRADLDRARPVLRVPTSPGSAARIQEQQAKQAAARRSQVSTGDRSAKIRTYNFPQGRVTDHRIGLTLHSIGGFMEGDLDEMSEALMAADVAERLAALGAEE